MSKLDQVQILRLSILNLEKSCSRLDTKFYDTNKLLADITTRFDEELAILITKAEALLALPIFEVTEDGAQEMEIGKFLDNIVDIYPDFQNALVMLHEAVATIVSAD